jgi:uncharacterized protein (TIGR03086 family)
MNTVSDTAARFGIIAAGFTDRLVNIAPAQWSAPTPCSDWSVRDLVVHVIGTQLRVMTRFDESAPAEVEPNGDLLTQWQMASGAVADAVGDETRASTIVGGMFGEQPFESLVGRMVCTDLLVHTWDLARATGQGESLDPGAVSSALAFLASIDDAIRVPGGFAEKIAPAPGADAQTRFLNFAGRAV